jgi:hypothetical protein|tara:strand:- start:210 stop:470 length:261 start_codon:yes stop_codon:yes gene_type:complete
MFLEISLVLVSLLFVTSCYVIWNLTTKLESLEDWVSDFIDTIEKIQTELKEIDYRGSFESDDETGAIFEQIKLTINQLNRFRGEEQ